MSTSQFCIQQRQQEQQRVRKLLWLGLASSIVLHGILAVALPHQLATKPPQVKKPMELILVDKPKPKPKLKETPIVPKPKPPQQKAPESKPEPKPEPPQQKAPEPKPEPPKPPEPKPEVSQPKEPTPRKILTSNLPPISKAPVAPQPQQAIAPAPVKNSPATKESTSNVATNSPPPTTESESAGDESGIACVSNCEPEYPDALEGAEGSAGVKLTIDPQGNVIGAELASADNNSQVNRQALLAARQMEFSSPPGGNAGSVQVKIDFTVEGSEYDRLAREEREKQEQAQKERQEKETAEKQAQQERLNREREAKALQEQQPQPQQPSILNTPTKSKPLPAPLETEVNDEQLREFRERMEKYRED
jgi:periplasmic protein TonB